MGATAPSALRVFPEGVAVNADGSVRFYNPDMQTIGRLRSLGRLLEVAGEKIADASSELCNNWLHESFSTSRTGLHACGTSLRDAAVALGREQWAEADHLIGVARTQCGTFLPNEHLAALQGLLGDSKALPDAREALKALSSVLEVRAELPVVDSLQDMFVEAAGAMRAAARLFSTPAARRPGRRAAPTAGRMGAIARAAAGAGVSPALACELEESMANAPGGNVGTALRGLAKKYHPDRHPGREMEVLPMFLYVQKLREESRWGPRA